jgi:hypothetical protein
MGGHQSGLHHPVKIETSLIVLKWMVGVNIVLTLVILVLL